MNLIDSYSNNIENVNVTYNQNKKVIPEVAPEKEEKKKDNTKLKLALAGLAVASIAAIGIAYKISKGQSVDLSKINFDKGVASLKENGTKFTGTVKDTLKNGDKIILQYENGILKQSSREGIKNIQKIYDTVNGEKIVKIIENGQTRISNITQLAAQGKEKAAKLAEEARLAQERAVKLAQEQAAKEAEEKAAKLAQEAKAAAEKTPKTINGKEVINVDLAQDLQEKKPENFIFGYTFADGGTEMANGLNREEVLKFLEENQDLTPDELAKKFGSFVDKRYDIPDKFMIAVNNQVNKTGSALIVDEVPEIFHGIDPKEIQTTIEKLQLVADKKQVIQFTMGGKQFSMEYINSGQIGNVFKIYDANNNAVALKFFKDPMLTGVQGVFAEMPIARQVSLDKVVDVPKFFMANPAGTYVDTSIAERQSKGAWQLVEYITPDKPVKQDGIKFVDWLKSKGLYAGDMNAGSKVGDYIIDVGGIIKIPPEGQKLQDVNLVLSNDTSESMMRGVFTTGENVKQWIEALKKSLSKG